MNEEDVNTDESATCLQEIHTGAEDEVVRIILYIFYIMIPILHFMRVDYTLYTFIRSTLYVLLSIYLSITLRTILSTYVSLHLYLIYIISSQ